MRKKIEHGKSTYVAGKKRDQEERTMNSGKEGLTNEKGYAQRKEPERIILNR